MILTSHSRKESQALLIKSGIQHGYRICYCPLEETAIPSPHSNLVGHPAILGFQASTECFLLVHDFHDSRGSRASTPGQGHGGNTQELCYGHALHSNPIRPGKERILWVKSWVSVLYLSDHAKRSHANDALNSIIILWLSLSRQLPTNLPQASQQKSQNPMNCHHAPHKNNHQLGYPPSLL